MGLTIPPHGDLLRVEIPTEHVLLLTLNRPQALNAMSAELESDLGRLLNWFETETSLWVVIVTGTGRAFCAGADLINWESEGSTGSQAKLTSTIHGFGSISLRQSTKPIIAAVNGLTFGGGMELVINCDLVVASEDAKFGLPEVKRGVIAAQGGIPLLAAAVGHQLASEMLLLGGTITAQEAYTRFGFVNKVVPPAQVLPTALEFAKTIVANSPDAVQTTKQGLLAAQNEGAQYARLLNARSAQTKRTFEGENVKEGLKAFKERRPPRWINPAKL